MKTKLNVLVLFIVLSVSSFAQESEKRFGYELNSGFSVATKDIAETNLNSGLGFEGILHYRFMPHLGVYGGWGWNRFGADKSFAGNDVCFEETGYVVGLNFKHQIGDSKVSYYARAGALYNHIETENSEGDVIHDSKHGWGYQLAGGLAINLSEKWSLTPGLKFNSLSRSTVFEGSSKKLDYQYISFRIGLARNF